MIKRRTILSEDRKYRYTLWREGWDSLNENCRDRGKFVVFIGLNPSTADETKPDNTMTRCVGFAKSWGFEALCMVNLFAYRTKSPREMKRQIDPVGPENDKYIVQMCREASLVIAAWGTHGSFLGRDKEVMKLIDNLHCLGTTQDGYPKHPLYLRADVVPCVYEREF